MRPVVAPAIFAATLALVAAPSAGAHGDPAGEYLAGHELYVPFDLKAPAAKERQLVALVDEANRAGFTLRVALVWSSYDLGARNALWQKPQLYARYLTADLRGAYTNRLLVVMPSGFGFSRLGRSSASERAALSTIPLGSGPTAFVDASVAAVQALAAASGVELPGATAGKPSTRSRDRVIIVIVAIALVALLRLGLRRRR